MAQYEVTTRGGDAFLLKLHGSTPSSDSVSEEQFFLLIGTSSIYSDRVILAMKNYPVDGHPRKDICEKYQMNNGYFSTMLRRLTGLDVLVARLTPYYTDSVSAMTEAAPL